MDNQTKELAPKLEVGIVSKFSRPQNFAEALEMANAMAKSDIVPNEYKGKPANILVASLYGDSVGLGMMQSLQSICVINGKPSMYGDVGLAIIQNSGTVEYIEETITDKIATCKVKRKGDPVEVIRTYTLDDARKAGLLGKDNWIKYPKRMLQFRARWWALRDKWPDKLKGLQSREEMEDYVDTTGEVADDIPLRKSQIESATGGGQTAATPAGAELISAEERKAIADLAADKGWTADKMKDLLARRYSIASSKDLPKDKLEDLRDILTNGEEAPEAA